jgi:hypothetical protein
MSAPWPTRVSPFKDKYGVEECIRGKWRFLFRLLDGGWGAMPGKRIINFDTPEEAEAYRMQYVEKISRPRKKKEPSNISTLQILGLIIAAFALFAHIYAIRALLKESPRPTTYLPDHNQSAICGE